MSLLYCNGRADRSCQVLLKMRGSEGDQSGESLIFGFSLEGNDGADLVLWIVMQDGDGVVHSGPPFIGLRKCNYVNPE